MSDVKVRYVIAWHPASSSWLANVNSEPRPFEAGWYRTVYDAEGREAYESGPHATAEECLNRAANTPSGEA
jgi:hypothetical protein